MALGCIGEIDSWRVRAHADGLDGACGRSSSDDGDEHRRHASATQSPSSDLHPSPLPPSLAGATIRAGGDAIRLYAYFAARASKPASCKRSGRAPDVAEKAENSIKCKGKYNLADVRAGFHARLRGGCLRERKSAVDQRPHAAICDERQHMLLHRAGDSGLVLYGARAQRRARMCEAF